MRAVGVVVVATLVVSGVLDLLHVPSPALFGGLAGGMVQGLGASLPLAVPPRLTRLGQGLVGVTIGTEVSLSALGSMGRNAPAIIAVTLGTIGLSLLAGRVLALRGDVSAVTGAFAMVAGGASGVVAIAHELGADDRVVTVVQYLRVFVVLIT